MILNRHDDVAAAWRALRPRTGVRIREVACVGAARTDSRPHAAAIGRQDPAHLQGRVPLVMSLGFTGVNAGTGALTLATTTGDLNLTTATRSRLGAS